MRRRSPTWPDRPGRAAWRPIELREIIRSNTLRVPPYAPGIPAAPNIGEPRRLVFLREVQGDAQGGGDPVHGLRVDSAEELTGTQALVGQGGEVDGDSGAADRVG